MSVGSESPGCRSEASDESMKKIIGFKRRKQNDGSSSPASTDTFSVESDPPGDASLCSTSQGGNRAPERRKRKLSLREKNLALREQNLTLREQNLTLREQNLALKEENRTLNEQNLKEKQALSEHNRALNEQNQTLNEQNRVLSEQNQTLNEQNRALNEKNQTLNEQNLTLKEENWTLNEKKQKEDPWKDPSLFISEGHRVVKDPREENLSTQFPVQQSDLSSQNHISDMFWNTQYCLQELTNVKDEIPGYNNFSSFIMSPPSECEEKEEDKTDEEERFVLLL